MKTYSFKAYTTIKGLRNYEGVARSTPVYPLQSCEFWGIVRRSLELRMGLK